MFISPFTCQKYDTQSFKNYFHFLEDYCQSLKPNIKPESIRNKNMHFPPWLTLQEHTTFASDARTSTQHLASVALNAPILNMKSKFEPVAAEGSWVLTATKEDSGSSTFCSCKLASVLSAVLCDVFPGDPCSPKLWSDSTGISNWTRAEEKNFYWARCAQKHIPEHWYVCSSHYSEDKDSSMLRLLTVALTQN